MALYVYSSRALARLGQSAERAAEINRAAQESKARRPALHSRASVSRCALCFWRAEPRAPRDQKRLPRNEKEKKGTVCLNQLLSSSLRCLQTAQIAIARKTEKKKRRARPIEHHRSTGCACL